MLAQHRREFVYEVYPIADHFTLVGRQNRAAGTLRVNRDAHKGRTHAAPIQDVAIDSL